MIFQHLKLSKQRGIFQKCIQTMVLQPLPQSSREVSEGDQNFIMVHLQANEEEDEKSSCTIACYVIRIGVESSQYSGHDQAEQASRESNN